MTPMFTIAIILHLLIVYIVALHYVLHRTIQRLKAHETVILAAASVLEAHQAILATSEGRKGHDLH